jgi:hypothetical protein
MNDPISAIARSAADRLGPEYGPEVAVEVEAARYARESARQKDQYVVDPVSLGTLIVTIATLAWNIYTDLKNKAPNPAPDVLTRMVRVELRKRGDTPSPSRDEVTEVVVTEIIRAAGDS